MITFRILAGILQLGNIEINAGASSRGSDSESSNIKSDDESSQKMAELFQIDGNQMRNWLCNRKIVTARETLTKPMAQQAVILQYLNIKNNNLLYKIQF